MTRTFSMGCSACGEKWASFSIWKEGLTGDEVGDLLEQVHRTALPDMDRHLEIASKIRAGAIVQTDLFYAKACLQPMLGLFEEG